jgi:hypothetical protein
MRSSRRSRPTNRDERLLRVEAGRVACPRRGVIDLELCFVCPHFSGFQEGITDDLVCGHGSVPGITDFSRGLDVGTRSVDTD